VQSRILQKHDGLAVANGAAADHCQSFINAEFQNIDIFPFGGVTAAVTDAVSRLVAADKEEQLFGDRAVMNASKTRCTSRTRKPVSSSVSARMRSSGLALSSSPAGVSMSKSS
jgi:hypothetical protein